MPIRPSANVVGKYVELPLDLVADAERFAVDRGLKFREVVIEALRRHLAFPPPPPTLAPLPTNEPAPTPAKKRKGGRS